MTIDQAQRIVAYSNLGETNVVVVEARQFIVDHETKIEQRFERWIGWDD